jgi:hypothetical protein
LQLGEVGGDLRLVCRDSARVARARVGLQLLEVVLERRLVGLDDRVGAEERLGTSSESTARQAGSRNAAAIPLNRAFCFMKSSVEKRDSTTLSPKPRKNRMTVYPFVSRDQRSSFSMKAYSSAER